MSILIDEKTRVVVLGITGSEGTFHATKMIEYGTKVVAGMTPGKGGTTHLGVPVYNTVSDAVREQGADAAAIFVPPAAGADAIMEAAEAGVKLVVCITEGIPTFDMMKVKTFLKSKPVGARRAEHARRHLAGEGQDRDHARPHPQEGDDRDHLEERNADVRGGSAGQPGRVRAVHGRRDRRRSDRRAEIHRAPDAVQGRSGHRGRHPHRRDRRNGRGRGRGLDRRELPASPWSDSSPGRPLPRGGGWGTRGRSSPGGKGTAKEKMDALAAAGVHVVVSPADMGATLKKALKG